MNIKFNINENTKNPRPFYLSDNGPRPKYRGTAYKITQDYSITILWIAFYLSWAIIKYIYTDYSNSLNTSYFLRPTILLIVRFLHSFSIYRNHFLSDRLHNHDKRYKDMYLSPDYISEITQEEKKLHAEDWIATLGLCASHHILLLFFFFFFYKINLWDILLLAIQISAFFIWLKLYSLVLIGFLCTSIKWPKRPSWGYHEILHCSVILLNFCGIVIDISKNL